MWLTLTDTRIARWLDTCSAISSLLHFYFKHALFKCNFYPCSFQEARFIFVVVIVFSLLCLFLLFTKCNLSNQNLAQNLSKRDFKDPVIRNFENLRKLTQCQC